MHIKTLLLINLLYTTGILLCTYHKKVLLSDIRYIGTLLLIGPIHLVILLLYKRK